MRKTYKASGDRVAIMRSLIKQVVEDTIAEDEAMKGVRGAVEHVVFAFLKDATAKHAATLTVDTKSLSLTFKATPTE